MARTKDEILELGAIIVLVAFAAVSLCAATWSAFQSQEPSAQPIRIDLSSLRSSAADDTIVPSRAAGVGLPDDARERPALAGVDPGGRYVSAEQPDLGPRPEYELENQIGASGGSQDASAIEIRKAVRINGVDSGFADIRVSASSSLSISRDALTRILATAGRGPAAGQIRNSGAPGGFIDFEELRRQGFDVRFDARADRLVLSI